MLTRLLRRLQGPADNEAAPCEECGTVMAPRRGIRDHHGIFCSETCLDDWLDARVY